MYGIGKTSPENMLNMNRDNSQNVSYGELKNMFFSIHNVHRLEQWHMESWHGMGMLKCIYYIHTVNGKREKAFNMMCVVEETPTKQAL